MINIIKQLLDWIYHKNCYFCHKPSQSGLMCIKCYEETEINFPEPVKILDSIKIYSASLYRDNIKKLIRAVKYHKKKELAEPLAKIMYDFWKELEDSKEEYEIISMPLHIIRQKQRGYNHMDLVAQEFSKLTGYVVNNEIVERIKDTKPQYKLSMRKRMENMKDAFQIHPDKYTGKKLLLIDDICTSGATMKELISSFKAYKINNICVLVAANPNSDLL